MLNQSKIDPTRKTVGAIYRDAQFNGEKQLLTGDISYELQKSLVEDLNDTVQEGTKIFEGRQFYITVYERRDLQMKNAFVRRMIKMVYRPYPEADTLVFKVIPYANEVYFCWHLPARYEMKNMLNSLEIRTSQWEQEELQLFKDWENNKLQKFGFSLTSDNMWIENPVYNGDKKVSVSMDREYTVSTHVPNKPTELIL